MDIEKIISTISDLPVEQRAEIASHIFLSLNAPDQAVEQVWMDEVERRAREMDSGDIEMVPGDQAMQRLKSITEKQ